MDVGTGKPVCAAYRACRARARLPEVLASWSSKTFNTAAISRQVGVSRPTVVKYVNALERVGLVRLLPFYEGKKRPLLVLASSSRGGWTESIIRRLKEIVPESRFFWWKSGRIRLVDLVADLGTERIGFCFVASPLPGRRDWLPLDIASRRGAINRGFMIHTGSWAAVAARVVQIVPFNSFMAEFEDWILHRRTAKDSQEARARINSECLARGAWRR